MSDEMDFSNLAEMLGEFMSDSSNRQQIQSILSALGADGEEHAPQGTMGGMNPDNLQLMFKLQQVMSQMNNPESGRQTALLLALKPLLRPEKREKVDNAVKFLGIGRAIEAFRKIEGV